MSMNFLSPNGELLRGDSLLSNNEEYTAIFQDDGNLVIYKSKGMMTVIWASDTNQMDGDRLCMQEDCHLVMYNKAKVARWRTGVYFPRGDYVVRLTLTDEGKLVVTKDSEVVWTSDMNRGQKKW